MTGTRKATGAASGGSIAGDLQRVASIERDECGAFQPTVAPVVENHTAPCALPPTHANDFADDCRGTPLSAEVGIMTQ